jgi:EAL domain-containing protein (putative c-di-GMP-specific phosphodiesterase class I)
VVKTLLALGRELDMRVTVEGVETAKQAAFLDGADADQVQGFFFGRPIPASELSAVILKNLQKLLPMQPAVSSREPQQRIVKSVAGQ